jgi:hypothetical protein
MLYHKKYYGYMLWHNQLIQLHVAEYWKTQVIQIHIAICWPHNQLIPLLQPLAMPHYQLIMLYIAVCWTTYLLQLHIAVFCATQSINRVTYRNMP